MNTNLRDIDKKCPFCAKTVRSDATVEEYCKLCGMGITETTGVPKYEDPNGSVHLFCCGKCLSIYIKERTR